MVPAQTPASAEDPVAVETVVDKFDLKNAHLIIDGNFSLNYKSYKEGLAQLGIETLAERRDILCLNFALKCVKNEKMKDSLNFGI